MADFQSYLIVKGSDNTYIYEDPVKGSNGTAVVTKINAFINEVENSLNSTNPTVKGGLITADTVGTLVQLPPGPNRYVLTSDTSSNIGLAYEERVDLETNQSIGGVKTFLSSPIFSSGFTSNGPSDINDNLMVGGDITANDLGLSGSLQVQGATTLRGSLTTRGFTTFENNVEVKGNTQFRDNATFNTGFTSSGPSTFQNSITVAGKSNLNGNLSVLGSSTFSENITAAKDISVGGNLSVVGSTTVSGNFNVSGTTSFNGSQDIAGDISIDGQISGSSLSITNNALIGGNTTISGGADISGIVNLANKLNVTNDTRLSRDLSVLGSQTIGGDLVVSGEVDLNTGLDVIGNVNLDDTVINGTLRVIDATTLEDQLNVNGTSFLSGATSIGNTLDVVGAITGNSNLSVSNQGHFGGNLHTDGNITSYGDFSIDGTGFIGGNVTTNADFIGQDLVLSGGTQVGGTGTFNHIETNSLNSQGNITSSNTIQGNKGVFTELDINGSTNLGGDVSILGDTTIGGTLQATNISGVNTGDESIASSTIYGIVKTDTNEADPIVYTKNRVNALFIPLASKGIADGVATLDGSGKVPSSQLPPMNSLVSSVFGRNGHIVAEVGDYSATLISYTSSIGLVSTNTKEAIEEVYSDSQIHQSDNTNPHNVTASQVGAIPLVDKGVANGVATLGADSKIMASQLPQMGGLNYLGSWDASNNTPDLSLITPNVGDFYIIAVAGNTDIDGETDWKPKDWVIYDGSSWTKIDNTDQVSSIFSRQGAITAQLGDYNSDLIINLSSVSGTTISDAIDNLDNQTAQIGHQHNWSDITSIPTTLSGYGITDAINSNQLGATNGVAELDINGKLVDTQSRVISVFGREGIITAMSGDYTAQQISFTTSSDLIATNTRDVIEELYSNHKTHLANSNPHNITPTLIGAIPSTDKGIINGVTPLSNTGIVPDIHISSDIPRLSQTRYETSFTDTDLVSNVLTVTHNLNKQLVSAITIWSNGNKVVIPDEIEAISNTQLKIDFTSYGTLSGTWNVRIIA